MSITVTIEVAHLPVDYRKLALLIARRMRDEDLEPHTVRQLLALLREHDDVARPVTRAQLREAMRRVADAQWDDEGVLLSDAALDAIEKEVCP